MFVSFGRSSLVSDVKLINAEGAPDPKTLAKDFFQGGPRTAVAWCVTGIGDTRWSQQKAKQT